MVFSFLSSHSSSPPRGSTLLLANSRLNHQRNIVRSEDLVLRGCAVRNSDCMNSNAARSWVGSSNLRTRTYSCLKIWIEANPAITLNRVLNRDGQHILEEMKTWQEKEKSYFAQHEVKNHSDIWVDGNFSQELDTSTHFKLVNR